MKKLHINILHRIENGDTESNMFKGLMCQQEAAHNAGLKVTLLLGVASLYSEKCVEYAKQQAAEFGDELGLNLHYPTDCGLGEKFGIKDTMTYLMPFDLKIKLLSFVMDLFKEKIGYYPKSIVAYVFDARTLNWFYENYPCVKAAVTNCFEEGVKMFYGNQNQWYLFNDGGPWGAYYPSKTNSLIMAKDEEDYCGIVGLPHLNRDMLMAITSRDDLFSSHPHNVLRAKAYDYENMTMPYMNRFVDQWIDELKYNDYVYYNVFVGPNWLTDDTILEETGDFAKELYVQNMNYLGEKVSQNIATTSTMSEFAEWMKKNVKIGTPEVNKWRDIVCGSEREVYWYQDPYFRVTLDANIGGAICDLRPHIGNLEKNLGNDTENLQNMNYPYLISAEYRGGVHDGSIHTYILEVNGKATDLAAARTKATPYINENGERCVEFSPAAFCIDGVKVSVLSSYTFKGDGKIEISRKIIDCSDSNAIIKIKEHHCGCWGDTTYPEDMRGISLGMIKNEKREELDYNYLGRELEECDADRIYANIPQLNINVSMNSTDSVTKYKVTEGWMFRPFYYMEIEKELKKEEELTICLKIQQAE